MSPDRVGFYRRPTEEVAHDLIGCWFSHRVDGTWRRIRLVETEAYLPEDDPACHAFRGVTPRTRPMFEPGGILYVYFIYGMHWCANVVTDARGKGAAVLLRAGITPEGKRIDGPGRLARYLGLTGDDNGRRITSAGLRIQADDRTVQFQKHIHRTPRIGITRAVELPLRFLVASFPGDVQGA